MTGSVGVDALAGASGRFEGWSLASDAHRWKVMGASPGCMSVVFTNCKTGETLGSQQGKLKLLEAKQVALHVFSIA